MRGKIKKRATIRPLDPDDPRSLDHPSHDEQWRELAKALGRAMADRDFDRMQRAKAKGQDK